MGEQPRLAVFDLDGTITRHDSFVPYILGFVRHRPLRALRLLLAGPACIGYAIGMVGRGALKSAIIRAALGGVTRSELSRWNDRYLTRLLADGLFPEAVETIAAHRSAGDQLVMMSASPDLYVPEIARRLAFAQVICTQVRWNGDRLDGRLVTENRRGEEKTRCLEALRTQHPGVPVIAYANSGSDLAHMSRADAAVLVNGNRKARAAAAQLRQVRAVEWR